MIKEDKIYESDWPTFGFDVNDDPVEEVYTIGEDFIDDENS
jgi:hypothetical protein